MRSTFRRIVACFAALSTILAACSGGAGAPATIEASSVGSHGTLVVAGSNGMTLYQFSMDVANSGTSACTAADSCITTWPALTVPAGTTPTAGAGATGPIGTIPRTDTSGALQVTYNGRPLYFYSGDQAVGDATGVYPNWSSVTP